MGVNFYISPIFIFETSPDPIDLFRILSSFFTVRLPVCYFLLDVPSKPKLSKTCASCPLFCVHPTGYPPRGEVDPGVTILIDLCKIMVVEVIPLMYLLTHKGWNKVRGFLGSNS